MSKEFEIKEKIKLLLRTPHAFKNFIARLPPPEQTFFLKYAADLGAHVEDDPSMKFKKNNPKQLEFLDFTAPFQFFIGGNKAGKTATIGYKSSRIAVNKFDLFPRKATVGKPLTNWICGENRGVIEQTPLEELTKWLRPDQWRIMKKGSTIERLRIYISREPEIYSDFIIKPYEGGVDIFESANINGVIFADEEIPEEIFKAMVPRMVAHGAWLFNALTPTHGITYTKDLLDGKHQYAGLQADGLVQWVEADTRFNLENIDKRMYFTMIRTYGVHNDDGILLDVHGGKIENIEDVLDPTKPEPQLSPEGEIRLKGKFESLSGKVYPNFKRMIGNSNWHSFDMHELPDLSRCKFFAMLDYGRRDDFVFVLIAIDENDTNWFLEEEYRPGLETFDQAAAIRRICDNWEVRPLMIVADSQIKDKKAAGNRILDDYLEARYKLGDEEYGQNGKGEVILGTNFTNWRAHLNDKYSPATARSMIGKKLGINPKTGKPFYRFNGLMCPKLIRCLESAQWKKSGGEEKIAGLDDHGEACLRYYTRNNVTFESYETEEEAQAKSQVNEKYRLRTRKGGNYRIS